jgi:hypothetical protein
LAKAGANKYTISRFSLQLNNNTSRIDCFGGAADSERLKIKLINLNIAPAELSPAEALLAGGKISG